MVAECLYRSGRLDAILLPGGRLLIANNILERGRCLKPEVAREWVAALREAETAQESQAICQRIYDRRVK